MRRPIKTLSRSSSAQQLLWAATRGNDCRWLRGLFQARRLHVCRVVRLVWFQQILHYIFFCPNCRYGENQLPDTNGKIYWKVDFRWEQRKSESFCRKSLDWGHLGVGDFNRCWSPLLILGPGLLDMNPGSQPENSFVKANTTHVSTWLNATLYPSSPLCCSLEQKLGKTPISSKARWLSFYSTLNPGVSW